MATERSRGTQGNQRSLDAILQDLIGIADRATLREDHFLDMERSDEPLLASLVAELVSRNSTQLAYRETYSRLQTLLYNLAAKRTTAPSALRTIQELANLRCTRMLEAPVADFRVPGEIVIGEVSFVPYTFPQGRTERADVVLEKFTDRLDAVARVACVGDDETARTELVAQIDRVLHILTGAAWRLYAQREYAIPAVFGGLTGGAGLVYRTAGEMHFEAWHAAEGFMERPFVWPETLIVFGAGNLSLQAVLAKTDLSTMELKLLTSLEWLGEAAGLGSLRSRFLRIGAAFEALLGDRELPRDGLAAGLAERAAFLCGKTVVQRLGIDKQVRGFYNQRSRLIHGDAIMVSEQDVIDFGYLCCTAASGVAQRLAEIANDLSGWTRQQRYETGLADPASA